jgi:hypothetical protein
VVLLLLFYFCESSLTHVNVEEDIDDILTRLEKGSPTIAALMQPAVKEIKSTIQYSQAANLKRPIFFHPLTLGSHHTHFRDGILVEVVKGERISPQKYYDVLFDLHQTCV